MESHQDKFMCKCFLVFLEKKILPLLLPELKPETFRSRVRCSNHWAIPAPMIWCPVVGSVSRSSTLQIIRVALGQGGEVGYPDWLGIRLVVSWNYSQYETSVLQSCTAAATFQSHGTVLSVGGVPWTRSRAAGISATDVICGESDR